MPLEAEPQCVRCIRHTVYHYLRHLSRTRTRVYVRNAPAFTQDLSLFTSYKSRNTALSLAAEEGRARETSRKYVSKHCHRRLSAPRVHFPSKWPVSALQRLHGNLCIASRPYPCIRGNPRAGGRLASYLTSSLVVRSSRVPSIIDRLERKGPRAAALAFLRFHHRRSRSQATRSLTTTNKFVI